MDLMMTATAGLSQLDVSEKVKSVALTNLQTWLADPVFSEYAPQVRYLIEVGKWDVLLDSFYQVIPFGTGGRRGPVGIGPNRINAWTIQASAQGHSQYLLKIYGEAAKRRGVVMTFDVRMPTRCWIAPLMPQAMYKDGLTTLPVCPTWRLCGW